MNTSRLSVFTIAVAIIAAQIANAEDSSLTGGFRHTNDIQYAEVDGRPLLLDLYLPEEVESSAAGRLGTRGRVAKRLEVRHAADRSRKEWLRGGKRRLPPVAGG